MSRDQLIRDGSAGMQESAMFRGRSTRRRARARITAFEWERELTTVQKDLNPDESNGF